MLKKLIRKIVAIFKPGGQAEPSARQVEPTAPQAKPAAPAQVPVEPVVEAAVESPVEPVEIVAAAAAPSVEAPPPVVEAPDVAADSVDDAEQVCRIEVRSGEGFGDPHADGIAHQIEELGITSVTGVGHTRLFFLCGAL